MAITKKPKKGKTPEIDVNALIGKGGSISKKLGEVDKPVFVQLRLSKELVERIDEMRAARAIKIPRHTWLLEAIHEKLATGK